jgi:hypothetical protein
MHFIMYACILKKFTIIKFCTPFDPRDHPLDTRVVLGVLHTALGVCVPRSALAVELRRVRLDLANPVGLLQELDGETFVCVPCDVAVL